MLLILLRRIVRVIHFIKIKILKLNYIFKKGRQVLNRSNSFNPNLTSVNHRSTYVVRLNNPDEWVNIRKIRYM